MLIIGAGGFSTEILSILLSNDYDREVVFFDNISKNIKTSISNKFKILNSFNEVEKHYNQKVFDYCLGLGDLYERRKLKLKMNSINGRLKNTISSFSNISLFNTEIGTGNNIFPGSKISSNVKIGDGCIIYFNSVISHDCSVGDYVQISPNSTILGNCIIGSNTLVGAQSVILPKIKVGNNVIIGAGSVVNCDIPDNSKAYGVPIKIFKNER